MHVDVDEDPDVDAHALGDGIGDFGQSEQQHTYADSDEAVQGGHDVNLDTKLILMTLSNHATAGGHVRCLSNACPHEAAVHDDDEKNGRCSPQISSGQKWFQLRELAPQDEAGHARECHHAEGDGIVDGRRVSEGDAFFVGCDPTGQYCGAGPVELLSGVRMHLGYGVTHPVLTSYSSKGFVLVDSGPCVGG